MVCASERKMGSRESPPQTENIPVLDRVGPTYRPLWRLPPKRLSSTVLLANGTFDKDTVLLLHDEDRRTFLIGPCNRLKLGEVKIQSHFMTVDSNRHQHEHASEFVLVYIALLLRKSPKDGPGILVGTLGKMNQVEGPAVCESDSVNDERECNELRGHRIQQVVFNESGIYVLTEEGMLFSSGVGSCGELGRSTTDVPGHCFGRVPIDGAVIAVAAEGVLVLAMTKKKVYAFGTCWHMTGIYHTPREIYTGKGSDAPKQVACGLDHSVILTVGGQVLTWGRGGYTGQGHTEVIPSMTVVRGLEGLRVQQVGCTRLATYALADAVLIGWGDNGDGSLGVGHRACVGYILEPTVIDCGGHRISNFRCSSSMMLAVTDNNEALYWGRCSNGSVINRPQPVEGYEFPRQILARDRRSDSGGVVYLTSTDECHGYHATSLHAL